MELQQLVQMDQHSQLLKEVLQEMAEVEEGQEEHKPQLKEAMEVFRVQVEAVEEQMLATPGTQEQVVMVRMVWLLFKLIFNFFFSRFVSSFFLISKLR